MQLNLAYHSLHELVHTSAYINKLLLACIERMAARADVYSQIYLSGKCLKCSATSALYSYKLCLRMNISLHIFHLSSKIWRVALRMPYRIYLALLSYFIERVMSISSK